MLRLEPYYFMKRPQWKRGEEISIGEHSQLDKMYRCSSNYMLLNWVKTKEIYLSLTKKDTAFQTAVISNNPREVVSKETILGLTMSESLKWSEHVTAMVLKGNCVVYLLCKPNIQLILDCIWWNLYTWPKTSCCRWWLTASPLGAIAKEMKRIKNIFNRACRLTAGHLDQTCLQEELTNAICRLYMQALQNTCHSLHHIVCHPDMTKYNMRHQRFFT